MPGTAVKRMTAASASSDIAIKVRWADGKPHFGPLPAPDNIAKLLIDTGTPEPWARPSMLHQLESRACGCCGLTKKPRGKRWPPYVDLKAPTTELLRRARATLVEFTENAELCPPDDSNAPLAAVGEMLIAEQLALRRLIAALEAFNDRERYPPRKLTPVWHSIACYIWEGYRDVIGDVGMSKHGPAVRFVQSVLTRADCGSFALDAIEKALSRRQQSDKRPWHPTRDKS